MKHFDYIILICPIFSWNKTYQQWKYINDSDLFSIEYNQDNVDKILYIVKEIFKGTNSLYWITVQVVKMLKIEPVRWSIWLSLLDIIIFPL